MARGLVYHENGQNDTLHGVERSKSLMAKTTKKHMSYVISVSLGTGCYRHIRLSSKKTLHDLADAILQAFDFDFDHLYSFFMDNKLWSMEDAYHSPYAEESPFADEMKLVRLHLVKGQQFKFLFDYGDEWCFQCKVLQVLEEDTPEALIVRTKGKAPQQYPDYDEDSDGGFDPDFDDSDDEPFEFPEIKVTRYSERENPSSDHASAFANETEFEIKIPEIPDELMEAAFQFHTDKLWKKLYDSELFAVKLSDGRIGYCCIMGYLGECIALALYIGDEGLRSYRVAQTAAVDNELNAFGLLITQNCLQAGFDNKSDLPDEAISPVREYAKGHGINLRGKKTYPNFMKFKSYYAPSLVYEESDFQYLTEALHAAHAVSEELKKSNKTKLSLDDDIPTIPLLTPDHGEYKWSLMKLSETQPDMYPKPKLENDALFDRIKKLKKCGEWECQNYLINQPAPDNTKQFLIYPSILLCVDLDNGQSQIIEDNNAYPKAVDSLIDKFAEILLNYGTCPETILTCGERSLALLGDFCQKCGIQLKETEDFTLLQDVFDEVMSKRLNPYKETQMMYMLEMLGSLSEDELREMPPMLLKMLSAMIGMGDLPPSLESKLKKIINT